MSGSVRAALVEGVVAFVGSLALVCLSPLSARGADGQTVDRLRAENARLRDRLRQERVRSIALEVELVRQGTLLLDRELAWRDFQGELGRLRHGMLAAAALADAVQLGDVEEAGKHSELVARVDRELAEKRARAQVVCLRLNALLRVEGLTGFDVFDLGLLASDMAAQKTTAKNSASSDSSTGDGASSDGAASDGAASDGAASDSAASDGATSDSATATAAKKRSFGAGPVVVRLLDHRGVLSGSLIARRMHLEASRTGHNLTIVLTDGVHREGLHERPFTGGTYRIPLRHVDPRPFIEDCGVLFDSALVDRVVDDGRWSLPALALTLDRLLSQRRGRGGHRIEWIGGVVDGEFRDVEVVVTGDDGRVLRRILADGMSIEIHRDHVRLVLRDGLTVSGESRAPFLDGRMRIVLTGADPERWRASHVPFVDVGAGAKSDHKSERVGEANSAPRETGAGAAVERRSEVHFG